MFVVLWRFFGFWVCSFALSRGLPGSPGGESLFFASPKKSNQKKGDPQSGSLRCASGNFRCSKSAEFLETSRLRRRQTSKNLFPLPPALLSPARTGWGNEFGFGEQSSAQRLTAVFDFVPPTLGEEARSTGKSGSGRVLSERSEFARDPTFTEHRSVPVAQRRDDEQGRLFFAYFLLAKQKKVSCCRATPGMLAKGASLTNTQRRQQEANK